MTDKTLTELVTDTGNVSDVIPSEEFSEVLLDEAEKGAKLEPAISAVDERLNAGEGDTLQVPIFPTVEVSDVDEGDTISATDYDTQHQQVTVQRYGARVAPTSESIYEANVDLVQKILDSMRRGLSNKMDSIVATQIGVNQTSPIDFTPAKEVSLSSASDIYDDLRTAKEALDTGGWNPDTVVMGYDLEGDLIGKQEGSSGTYQIRVEDGRLSGVHGLDVILTEYANDYSDASSGDGIAAVLDTDVAVAEGRGETVKLEEERVPEDDVTEQILNGYFGFSEITADWGSGTEAFGIGLLTKA